MLNNNTRMWLDLVNSELYVSSAVVFDDGIQSITANRRFDQCMPMD